MTKSMILPSGLNVIVSASKHTTISTSKHKPNVNKTSVLRIPCIECTESKIERIYAECEYVWYNKNKKYTYKHCNCCCDNLRRWNIATFPVNILELHTTINRNFVKEKWLANRPHTAANSSILWFNPCYDQLHGEADEDYNAIERNVDNKITEFSAFLQDYKCLDVSTAVYTSTIKTNCRYEVDDSLDRIHGYEKSLQCESSFNEGNYTCANDMSTDIFRIRCNASVLGIATSSKKDKNEINNESSASNRMRCRSNILRGNVNLTTMCSNAILYILLVLLLSLSQVHWANSLLTVEPKYVSIGDDDLVSDSAINNNPHINVSIISGRNNRIATKLLSEMVGGGNAGTNGGPSPNDSTAYMDKLKMNNLEQSVAAVLKKVAYGTTSTTKRSIPDNSYIPSLTTIATPLLTTLRYAEKSTHQQQINLHHRNYELDLERDHALPTSAPNADILKSNSNPTYPNPNRHHSHERERHRHVMNSTPLPSIPNILKKNIGQLPTIPMYPGDIPSYSPPARSFFTPPLPPEYQNPFADKPTLRGTNNEGIISNTGTYINRRPIPPPSLMPGHERIPFRPPDLAASTVGNSADEIVVSSSGESGSAPNLLIGTNIDAERKKALNTPSRSNGGYGMINVGSSNIGGVIHTLSTTNDNGKIFYDNGDSKESPTKNSNSHQQHSTRQEVLPSIRRILSGSNGNKGEIPEVLLKQATSRPTANYDQPPSSPVVLLDGINVVQKIDEGEDNGILGSSNINKNKNSSTLNNDTELYDAARIETIENRYPGGKSNTYISHHSNSANSNQGSNDSNSTPSTAAAVGGELGVAVAAAVATSTMSSTTVAKSPTISATVTSGNMSSGVGSSTAAAASSHSTWAVAWNIHVYFSVVLFTILVVYSLYKVLTYNKLTHLFSQSYFMCIHLVLIVICSARIFYLCFDAYNIHATFNLLVSELLLNLPATFLTISFSVLILYLFLKALNHKNNRYSALIRPLTVVVGCGVHVILCITLHYVESYTVQNQQQQQLLYQQQQQQLLHRRQQQQQQLLQHHHQLLQQKFDAASKKNLLASVTSVHTAFLFQSATVASSSNLISSTTPPRVLSLICQIIYIFVCLFLGLLYLYLYRILKRILRSKSQNYIHGYQNLSYAIHITIATALLYVLLAALQIFGAISISTTRPLMQQLTAEIDWLQWGYQFSLRLIEIAIITLLSWVVGLKTSSGAGAAVNSASNGDTRYGAAGANSGSNVAFASGPANHNREKHPHHHFHNNHSNVAGFFLPCTSSSSQEQFETDYPAVCNANTNLHTYTMRTGKLIYDDSFALNSLSSGAQLQLTGIGSSATQTAPVVIRNVGEFQVQSQPTYQRPYDSGSINSAIANHNISEYGTQSTLAGGGGGAGGQYGNEAPQYTDYLTDATTDHYENPNFDLCGSVSGSGFGIPSSNPSGVQKLIKTSTTSTTASSSGGSGSSAASQQQKLLLQSDNCYSEPLQVSKATSYDFNNFERPQLGSSITVPSSDCWLSKSHTGQPLLRSADNHISKRGKKIHSTLDRSAYENPERRSSNSTHSCASSNGRYGGYNSFDRGLYNGVRKSGTLNNIVGGGNAAEIGVMHGRNSSSSSAASSNISAQRICGAQTLSLVPERHHYQQQQRSGRAMANGTRDRNQDREHDYLFSRSSLDRSSAQPSHKQQNSDDDMMLSGSNVERTNLIDNEDGSCIINSNITTSFCGGRSQMNDVSVIRSNSPKQMFANSHLKNDTHSNTFMCQSNSLPYPSVVNTTKQQNQEVAATTANTILGPSGSCASNFPTSNISATSSTVLGISSNGGISSALLVAEHGFLRFRAIDDINNAQGIGIHNASILN